MQLKQFVVGQLEVNCWLVTDKETLETFVLDPGDEPDRIEDWISTHKLNVKYIICTHSHFDHVGALPELEKSTGAEILLHRDELPVYARAAEMARSWGFALDKLPEPKRFVADGDEVRLGKLVFKVIHTPGHSPGGICLQGEGVLFSGDTLFAGSIGRTDLPGGSYDTIMASLKKLAMLPEKTAVHPGHGLSSTIGQEIRMNPFMRGRL